MASLGKKYLGFDDRQFMVIGMIVTAFLLPIVFFGIYPWERSLSVLSEKWAVSLVYVFIFWIGIRWLIIKIRQRYPHADFARKRIYLEVVLIIIYSLIVNVCIHYVERKYGIHGHSSDGTEPSITQGYIASYFTSFFVLAIYEAIYFYHQLRESLLEQERFKQAHIRSQLAGLRNQVNPHFLFNSINTLMNMIKEDPSLAQAFLAEMAKVYRYLLENRQEQLVSLKKERSFLDAYLFLQKERFRGNLKIDINIPAQYEDWQVVPLSLQMLTENAIKHNVVSQNEPLHIRICIDEDHQLWVVNNLQRKNQNIDSTGVGLDNLRTRYGFFTKREMEVMEDTHSYSVSLPLLSPQTQSKFSEIASV